MNGILSPLVSALRTLTVLPVPGRDTTDFSRSLLWFPLVGALLAALAWPFFPLSRALPAVHPGLWGLALTVLSTVVTGALHLDGSADVADGFGAGGSRERTLEILKDPRHGTFGVTAIVLDLACRVLCCALLVMRADFWPLALALVCSRGAQALAISVLPSAQPESSIAAAFAGARPWASLCAVLALGGTAAYWCARGWLPMVWVAVAACLAAGFLGYARKRIGGITGDCVGAVSEIVELAILVCAVSSAC